MQRSFHSSRFYHPHDSRCEYRSLSSSLCSFLHSPVISSVLGPNILHNILFSNTLSLCLSPNLSDQVAHPVTKYNYVKKKCQICRKITAFILDHFQKSLSLLIIIKCRFRMRKKFLIFN
jgi:hypothetical protein